MELVAYVNGDVMTLTRILSQIAMTFSGDIFAVALKTAALIGIIIALYAGIFRGGQISPTTFFWPVITVVLFILPRVDLVIEDRSGGLARIDNLPIGFAAPVSLITHVGQGVSRLMTETLGLDSYQVTMDNGHLMSLRAPVVYSQVITDEQLQGPASTFPNGLSPTKDALNYVTSCLAWSAKTPNSDATLPNLQNRPISDLRESNKPTTVHASNGRSYECGDLYDRLMEGFESNEYQDRLNAAINKNFGKYANDSTTGDRYQIAMESVSSDPSEFYKAAAFSHALRNAPADITRAAGGGSQAAALDDALAQKREKNFGAASMIFETISQSIEFIEVWSFSLFPLAMLVLMLGAIGGKMAVKYFWMLVWIQLWYPTILIVIAYTDAKLQWISVSNTQTVGNYNAFMHELLRLQDVSYLHLSMATMLSMMLIYGGSAFLAASVQRDLTGDTHYDPKKNEPDSLSRNAEVAFHSPFSYSPNQGYLGHAAHDTFAGASFSLDRSKSSGVSWAEVASFARSGVISAGSSLSQGSANSATTSTTETNAATKSWSASSTKGTGVDYTSSAAAEHGIGSSSAEALSYTRQKSAGATAGASASYGWGGGGSGPSAGVSGGVSGSISNIDSHRFSNSSDYNIGQRIGDSVSMKDSAGSSLNQQTGEQNEKSRIEGQQQSETNSQQETAGNTQSETRSDSENESITASNVTTLKASSTVDAIRSANWIARDEGWYNHLVETVNTTGISNFVEDFERRNADKLDATFSPSGSNNPDAERAKFALAATYVMQGMAGNPYAGQQHAQERMEALNALSDQILMNAAPFSSGDGMVPSGPPALDGLASSSAVDGDDLWRRYTAAQGGFDLSQESVASALDRMPSAGSPEEAYKSMEDMLGVNLSDTTEAQGNAILTEMRSKIDREFGPLNDDAQSFMHVAKDLGYWGALQDKVAFRDVSELRRESVIDAYSDAANGVRGQGDIPFHLESSEHSGETYAAAGEAILEKRFDQLRSEGIATEDSPVARYMTLAQMAAGAHETGAIELGGYFSTEMTKMEQSDPALADGETASRIQALALTGATEGAMKDSMIRAQQEYAVGGFQAELADATGHSLNSVGVNTSWVSSGAFSRSALADGIRETADELGMDPLDLGTIISYETAGTFDPEKRGPVTQHGQHIGLIQFGEWQAREHGVDWDDPLNSQLGRDGAIVSYFRDAGWQPGMGLLDAYSAVNAGYVGRYNASDANNGGAPGTVRDKVENQMHGHRQNAQRLLGLA